MKQLFSVWLTLLVTVAMTITSVGFHTSSAAAATNADLATLVSGPSFAPASSAFSYDVTVLNRGTSATPAPVLSVQFDPGASGLAASCSSATGGATCQTPNSASNGYTVNLGLMPAGATVKYTVTGSFPPGVTSFSFSAETAVGTGYVDLDTSNNLASVSTALSSTADLAVSLAVLIPDGRTSVLPSDTLRYTARISNNGPYSANGAVFTNRPSSGWAGPEFGALHVSNVSCVASGGASCGTYAPDYQGQIDGTVPVFPPGSYIEISYDASFEVGTGCFAGPGARVLSYVSVNAVGLDPVPSNNYTTTSRPAIVTPCPTGDIEVVSVTSPTTLAVSGEALEITAVYRNNGPGAANGSTITIRPGGGFGGAGPEHTLTTLSLVSCDSTGGAVCPSFVTSSSQLDATVSVFPAGSTLTVVYSVTFDKAASGPLCYEGTNPEVRQYTAVRGPSTYTDTLEGNNVRNLYTPAVVTYCNVGDLKAELTYSAGSINPGQVETMVAEFTNAGPDLVNSARVMLASQGHRGGATFDATAITIVSCEATGGGTCPTDWVVDPDGHGIARGTVNSLPPGGTVTVTFTATFVKSSTSACDYSANHRLWLVATITQPAGVGDANIADNTSLNFVPIGTCADVSASNTAAGAERPLFGAEFELKGVISSGGTEPVTDVDFTYEIGQGATYVSSSCNSTGKAVCHSLTYDAASNTLSGTVDSLEPGESVTVTVAVLATDTGVFPSSLSASPRLSQGLLSFFDPNPSTNVSVNSYVVDGTAPSIAEKILPDGVLGEQSSFSIDVTGTPAFVFEVLGGALPPGVALNPVTGVISGLLESAGSFDFTVRVSNAFGFDDQQFTWVVTETSEMVVERLWGADRYATSVEVSKQFDSFAGAAGSFVYLATGENFPDALVAAPAAALRNAPLLLTRTASLPANVADEIRRLDPEKVIIAGGPGAVSAAVQASVGEIVGASNVIRLGGASRYETAELLVNDAFPSLTAAYVATGSNFPDALAASAAAAKRGIAVMVTPGSANALGSPALNVLGEESVAEVFIAGGPGVVSEGIRSQLASLKGESQVTRLGGATRYETAVLINRGVPGGFGSTAYVATGASFPDALGGAALAGATGMAVYLSPTTCVTPDALADLLTYQRVRLLGGEGVLSARVFALEACSG